MNRFFTNIVHSGVLGAAIFFGLSLSAYGQIPQEVDSLASRAAERVAKAHQKHIFIAGLKESKLDPGLCEQFETSLRAAIEKMIPGAHFVQRDSVINILQGRGFLAVDAYFPDVLRAVASAAGADILVTDTLQGQRDGYELIAEVYDTGRAKKLDEFRIKVARPVSDSDGELVVFTDPESKTSLIISRGSQSRPSLVELPKCVKCPDPSYTPEAKKQRIEGRVLIMATITVQGVAEGLGLVNGLAGGLSEQAAEALRSWQFKPAMGSDGKPIAARTPIEFTFRLL